MEQGQPAEALRLFLEAHRLHSDPRYLYNIALANVALGRNADAFIAFRTFIAKSTGVRRVYVEDAQKQIVLLMERVAIVDVSSNLSGATVIADGRDVGLTPLDAPLVLDPGEHRFLVRKKGVEPFERMLILGPGESTRLRVELQQTASFNIGRTPTLLFATVSIAGAVVGGSWAWRRRRGPGRPPSPRPARDRVFLSYRRRDTPHEADRMAVILRTAFGERNVFQDVAGIAPGDDFMAVIEAQLNACGLVLAIIGPGWIRRSDGAAELIDFVQVELETARRLGIPIVPVLVREAPMPSSAQLTPSLSWLPRLNAVNLRPHEDFDRDMERLISSIKGRLAERPEPLH